MKKFRLLSSLLAALMVFSMLTAMPVGAAQTDTNLKTFDNMTIAEERTTNAAGTTTYAAKRYIPQASEYENIFQYVSHTATSYDVARVKHDDLTFAEGESGTDYALGATTLADYWIGWPIDGDTGIEVYEFDCYYKHPSSSTANSVYVQLTSGSTGKSGEFFKLPSKSSWQHIKIEYNTNTDILTAYVDGAKTGNTISAPNGFQNLLRLNQPANITNRTDVVLAIDNYMNYVKPLMKTFDNMPIEKTVTQSHSGTTTYATSRYIPQASEYENIFQYVSHTSTTYDVVRVKHDNLAFSEGESGTDYALGATMAADYWIGWPIDGDTGIEVYEFDCYYKHPSASTANSVYVQLTSGAAGKSAEFFKLPSKSSWQHIRIEYNTNTDILTAYVDGAKTGNTISAPNGFQNLLRLNQPANTTSRQDVVLAIDNYISYVKPLVHNLELTMNGNEVESAGTTGENGDTVVVTADIINTSSGYDKITIIYALYNGDELVDAKSADINVDVETENISHTFTTKANVSYTKVKAFIWDGLTTRTPLTVAASYPSAE